MTQSTHSLGNLREIRELLGFKPATLAKAIAIEPNSYMRIERGERRIHWDKAWMLASVMGIDVNMLGFNPLTSDQRVELFRRGEEKRKLQSQAETMGVDPGVLEEINSWDDVPALGVGVGDNEEPY